MYNRNNLKKIALIVVWVLVIAMVITTFSFTIFGAEADNGGNTIEQQLAEMEEVINLIDKDYVEKADVGELIDGAYRGIFDQLDVYSQYFPTTESSNYFSSVATGEFYGIGINFVYDENGVIIKKVSSGKPAKKAGILAGDYIISIDGVPVENKTTTEILGMLRSAKESDVQIVIQRDNKQMTFKMTRELMNLSSVSYRMLDQDTAYINVRNFYKKTPEEFIIAYSALKNENPQMDGLVVDVRENNGGLVASALSLASLFLNKNDVIMNYVKQNEVVYTYNATGKKLVDTNTVVITDNMTASAAEVFCAALKENDAAVIVGAETYGKGIAQTMTELSNGAVVKLSTFYFTSPKNNTIHGVGVTPSYIIYNGDNKAAISRYKNMKTVANMDEQKEYSLEEKGLNVYAAQQRLQILGYEGVALTGIVDEATQKALKELQVQAGISVNGCLGTATAEYLENLYQTNVFGIEDDIQLAKACEVLKAM